MARSEADAAREVRVRCDCGEWLTATGSEVRGECACGATYAVTVSQLVGSSDR